MGETLVQADTEDSFEQGLLSLARGKLEDALEHFTSALAKLDSETSRDRWLLVHAQLGEIYFRLNRFRDAETHLNEAANGGMVESLVTLAVISERDNDITLATARRVLAASRGDVDSNAWLVNQP